MSITSWTGGGLRLGGGGFSCANLSACFFPAVEGGSADVAINVRE